MGQVCDAIRQEGLKIGEANGINSVITTMLKKGFSIDVISDATDKSKEYILKIKEEKNLQ